MKARLLLLLGALFLIAAAEAPPKPVPLEPQEALKQGRALATDILSQSPSENSTNRGVMKIRQADGTRLQLPIEFVVLAGANAWQSTYRTIPTNIGGRLVGWELAVVHDNAGPPRYVLQVIQPGGGNAVAKTELSGDQLLQPFAATSDFWPIDLGLEFLRWPDQRITGSGLHDSRRFRILESVNPRPGPLSYSRVVSRVDLESGGIFLAVAYDANNKPLKEFAPKGYKKVNGVWQVEEMEMDNRQTDSRTLIQFKLDSK